MITRKKQTTDWTTEWTTEQVIVPRAASDTGQAAAAATDSAADALADSATSTDMGSSDVETTAESSRSESQHGWDNSFSLVEVVANTSDQQSAIIALVSKTAELFPDSSVRCGIGNANLQRFYDSRLGWLSPASELFQNAAGDWSDANTALPTGKPDSIATLTAEPALSKTNCVRLNIDDQTGTGRCVLWIENHNVQHADRLWLRKTLPALRSLVWQRTGGVFSHLARSLANSGMTTRIYLGLAALMIMLCSIWPVSYRVRCTAVVRPLQSRVVAVPFAATLAEALVEPGNTVKAGDLMLLLDGRPLRLELEAIDAQIAQVSKKANVASFSGDVAEAQQAKLRARELSRRRDLLIDRLSRLRVTAPIDGVVVAGDLKRSIGTPMEVGQAVFEVAPLDEMVVELEVPEYEIGYVQANSDSRIRLTASKQGSIDRPIDQLFPAAELRDGMNVFVARVDLDNSDGSLRPGMRGNAIVYGPLRPWLWSLVRGGWEKTLWWVGY